MFVQGNNYSSNYTFFDITFKRWTGTDSKGNAWQSSADIDTALDRASITIAMVRWLITFRTLFKTHFYFSYWLRFWLLVI